MERFGRSASHDGVRYSDDFEPQLQLPLEPDTVALFRLEPDLESVPDEMGYPPTTSRVPLPRLP